GLIGETRSLSPCRLPWISRSLPNGPGSFFKSGRRRLVLGSMGGAGRELAIVHGPQLAAQRLLGDRDAELLPSPRHEIDQSPAHHAVNRRDRAGIKLRLQSGPMRVGGPGGRPGRLAFDKASG